MTGIKRVLNTKGLGCVEIIGIILILAVIAVWMWR